MRTWQPHTTRFSALVFSPDGRLLATTAGQSKVVWLWDAASGTLVRKLSGNEYPARSVAFSPDGRHLAGMQAGDHVRVWEVATGKLVATLALEGGGPKTLAFSPDGAALFAPDLSRLYRWDDPTEPTPGAPRARDAALDVWAPERVGFSPSGRLVSACHGVVILTAAGPGLPSRQLANPVGWAFVNDFAFTRDESRLAVAYQSTTAAVFDLTDPSAKPVLLRGHNNKQVRAIGFAPDGRTVVTVGNDGTSRFWDAVGGGQLRVFDWGVGVLAVAAFAPDGLTCAAGSDKGQVVVWDIDQ
jgi:WD40 repeat protein